MNIAVSVSTPLPALIDRASKALAGARTSAEILEARDQAGFVYDIAKKTARLAKAKGAHDALIAAAHRAQADALEIESGAKRRLADEYDDAQERGEVASARDGKLGRSDPERLKATAADVGLSRKEIHEARKVRDAEVRDPGVVRRTLDEELKQGREPTKAALRRAISDDDEDSEDDDLPEPTPDNKREAFLIFSNEAMLMASYDGPVDERIVQAARDTESAWRQLVRSMEQQL